jgi:hypothetical protein
MDARSIVTRPWTKPKGKFVVEAVRPAAHEIVYDHDPNEEVPRRIIQPL